MNLVDAQQARRAVDRIVGYKLSPLALAKRRSEPVCRPSAERRTLGLSFSESERSAPSNRRSTGTLTASLADRGRGRVRRRCIRSARKRNSHSTNEEAATAAGRTGSTRAVDRRRRSQDGALEEASRTVQDVDPAAGRLVASSASRRGKR